MRNRALALAALVLLAMAGGAAWYLRPAPPRPALPPVPVTGPVDRIVIEKAARRMTLFQGGVAAQSYPIALGFTPVGDKRRQGDGKTPEGSFRIDRRNPQSKYHLSLGIDYPRATDRERAAAAGVDPGGDIFIHGQPNGVPESMAMRGDWTAGCIAVTNAEMREIWDVVPLGTEVVILP